MLFTDAVFEGVPGPDNRDSGLAGLAAFIETNAFKPSKALAQALYLRRAAESPFGLSDDFTLMIFDQL